MPFDPTQLASRIATLSKPGRVSARQLFFRSVNYHYVMRPGAAPVLDGAYASVRGGRLNPPGSPTCYLAATQTGATFEVEQRELLLGLSRNQNPPSRLIVPVFLSNA